MENIEKLITQDKLIKSGERIAVAVSGGEDSMALLTYLNNIKEKYDFELVAVTIDHCLRDTSASDAFFVVNYCRELGIRAYKFKVDVKKLAIENNQSLETAAREARYGIFKSLIKKDIVDKIALAHHMEDQAETVLLHILRGSGVGGAKGMQTFSEGIYIRPMLQTTKNEIRKYINYYDIPYVEDETNKDCEFSRNYIRNKIMPLINSKWPNAVTAINNFASACKEDDDYIKSQIIDNAIFMESKRVVKIPTSYFINSPAITSRMIFKAFKKIGVEKDIERKHIDLIRALALNGQNGNKIKLPMDVTALKEYDFVTLSNEQKEKKVGSWSFKCGSIDFPNFGKVVVKKSRDLTINENELIIDSKKLPEDVEWRYRREGDIITKFGGGTQKLKTYLSQKKIPLRQREDLPVLASLNEVYVVPGYGISDKVKLDENSKVAYIIKVN